MGPNGSGKSTLSHVLAGRDDYEVTQGTITLDGQDLLELEPEERAAAGVFLALQYPVEIPGVANMTFLKAALTSQRKARGEPDLSTADFMKRVRAEADKLGISPEMLKRPVNVGFSGGERKAQRDSADGGAVAAALRARRDRFRPRHRRAAHRRRRRQRAALARARHARDHPTTSGCSTLIVPDVVHVLSGGKIVKTGGPGLALGARGARVTPSISARRRREDLSMNAEMRRRLTAAGGGSREPRRRPSGGAPTASATSGAPPVRRWSATGLPSRRVEAYKYTDLRAAFSALAPVAPPADATVAAAAVAAAWDWDGLAARRIVFVNGRFEPGLSTLEGLDGAVEIASLAERARLPDADLPIGRLAGGNEDPVLALNTAFWQDGVVIRVAAGATVAEPIAILSLVLADAPVAVTTRHVVEVGTGATVRFLEHHAGPADVAYQASAAIELDVADGARVTWARLQEEGAGGAAPCRRSSPASAPAARSTVSRSTSVRRCRATRASSISAAPTAASASRPRPISTAAAIPTRRW